MQITFLTLTSIDGPPVFVRPAKLAAIEVADPDGFRHFGAAEPEEPVTILYLDGQRDSICIKETPGKVFEYLTESHIYAGEPLEG